MLHRFFPLALLAVAACGQPERNPPTEPATAITTPEAEAPAPTPPPGVGSIMPGSGPQTFVGRWAANTGWCANAAGAERPIQITASRFEGYENSCDITGIRQLTDGYEAALTCMGDGLTTNERVRLSVQGDSMRLTWLNRNGAAVSLVRCPTPEAEPDAESAAPPS